MARKHHVHHYRTVTEDIDLTVSIDLLQGGQDGGTRILTCKLAFSGHEIVLGLDADGNVTRFDVNSTDVLSLGGAFAVAPSGDVVPVVYEEMPEDDFDAYASAPQSPRLHGKRQTQNTVWSRLREELNSLFHPRTSVETREEIAESIPIGSSEAMLEAMRAVKRGGKTWSERVKQLSPADRRFERIRDLKLAYAVPFLLSHADFEISKFAGNVNYIAPVRATTERYYRPQNLAVEEVDFQGANMAMFLRNLTETQRREFRSWTEEHLNFSVFAKSSGGHISLRVREQESGKEHNLTDVGFGLSQVLPIIAQLWAITRPRPHRRQVGSGEQILFAIEQPELHLHPALQAKVADLFLSSVNAARKFGRDVHLVIETHSEAMINRIGHRIALNEADPEDVQIVMFEREGSDPSTIQFVKYDKDGFLEQWPLGFFEPELV